MPNKEQQQFKTARQISVTKGRLKRGHYGVLGLKVKARNTLQMARDRHITRNYPGVYDLTIDWYLDNVLYHDGSFKHVRNCPLAGVRFHLGWKVFSKATGRVILDCSGKANPYSPSLDRIDSKLGYTMDNCRIIMFLLNTLKKDGTDAELMTNYPSIIRDIQKDYEGYE